MDYTFGKTLLHFSYSCELVDDSTFSKFRDLVLSYTRKVLEIDLDRLFIQGDSDNPQKYLYRLELTRSSKFQPIPVSSSNGKYSSLAGLAYGKTIPLWVIPADPAAHDLRKCNQTYDLWSAEQDLPQYLDSQDHAFSDDPPRTAIIIPLRRDGINYGVHCFETSERLEATTGAKDELEAIATAMCNVYIANLHFRKRMKQTREACNQLKSYLQKPLPVLTKPKIFLASSHRADRSVIKAIKKTIEEDFKNTFKLVFWQDLHESGNINAHLLRLLSKCRFGICYFSEKVTDSNNQHAFQDNPNVIFEAGMLHSRSVNNVDFPADWIPIRELHSSQAPFDLRPERMIIVPRNRRGNLETAKFRKNLKKHLDELVPKSPKTRHQRSRVA